MKTNSNIKRAVRWLRGTGPKREKWQKWSIGIHEGATPYSVSSSWRLRKPVLSADSVSDARATFVADPFMIRADQIWHMFFEVMNATSGRGEIALASSSNAKRWNYRQIVLREPFHLSYPYVFEWEANYYIVPETYEANAVRLYKATDFPLRWEFVGDLISGDVFNDASIFRFNGKWWLLTALAKPPYWAGTLLLYYADSLTGPWTQHPKSPIIDGDPHISRPAGRVVPWDNGVIRFTQDCSPVYGSQVRAFKITELTTTTFQERAIQADPVLKGSGKGWNKGGMHHIDPHFIGEGQWVACVDGWHWES